MFPGLQKNSLVKGLLEDRTERSNQSRPNGPQQLIGHSIRATARIGAVMESTNYDTLIVAKLQQRFLHKRSILLFYAEVSGETLEELLA